MHLFHPPVKLDDCFTYLGRRFDFKMTDDKHKKMKNNINNIVSQYIRLWLEIPVNGTLNTVTQSKQKFELGVILPSTRHIQCRVTFWNKFRKSSYPNICNIPISTRNIHYDYFNSTCVIQHVRMPSNGVLPTAPPAQFMINNKSLVMSSVDAKLHC